MLTLSGCIRLKFNVPTIINQLPVAFVFVGGNLSAFQRALQSALRMDMGDVLPINVMCVEDTEAVDDAMERL